jgi:iron-sulfur cluster repair protein YtfE (RIC family)
LRRRNAPAPHALKDFLGADHARCEGLYALAEDAAQAGNLDATREGFESFALGMRRHFAMEEDGFFADLDARAGFSGEGPTEMMRQEHGQMRGLLDQMSGELAEGDLQRFLSAGETLLLFMEQHNVKEEQMLYDMADEIFGGETEAIVKRLLLF